MLTLFRANPLRILAVVGFAIVSFLAYHWLTQPALTPADITPFSGIVKEARVYGTRAKTLEITLVDQPYPFRCFSLYPQAFKFDLKGHLGPGALVTLSVPSSEISNPRRSWLPPQRFHKFVTMSLDNVEVLSLDAYNRLVEGDRQIGPWFCLVMALVCIWLFWISLQRTSRAKRQTARNPAENRKA